MNIHATEDLKRVINVIPVNPDEPEHEFKVDLGGTIELRLIRHDFDLFEITFDEPGPPGASGILTGTFEDPISIPMPLVTSDFRGRIAFKKKDGTRKSDEVPFLAKSCPACGGH
jgi:hypothetical protein